MERWRRALLQLPDLRPSSYSLGDVIAIYSNGEADLGLFRNALMRLHPWRKGPFNLFGIQIDAEWRSDLKWNRIAQHIDIIGHTSQ